MSRFSPRFVWISIVRGVLLSFLYPAVLISQSHLLPPQNLRCEALSAPLAVTSLHPILSWQLRASYAARDVFQAEAQVIIAKTKGEIVRGRGDIWNSGRVAQSSTSLVSTKQLDPETAYWWAVRTWDEHHHPSGWSSPARFITAAPTWGAPWIAAPFSTEQDGSSLDGSRPMPVFRRRFKLNERPIEALLSIAGLGQYDARIDDAPIAPGGLWQAWTDYRKTVTFDTFDITSRLRLGSNSIRVLLGNGMYNVQHTKGRYTKFEGSFGVPKLTVDLRLRYTDGRVEHIATDTEWESAPGPIKFSSTYGGEDFDANAERVSAAAWTPATIAQSPEGKMIPAIALPVLEQHHYPARLVSAKVNAAVYDLGQNIAGWPEIGIRSSKGAVLRITPGEMLNADGTVSQTSSGGPQWWSYASRGDAIEKWHPHFSYYGFRYLQFEWIKGGGSVKSLEGIALHSSSKRTGAFSSSSKLLNQIHSLMLAAMHNNEESLFTDCPHREKLGWLEETQLVAPSLIYNDDVAALYRATARNISDAQDPLGAVPTIAPQYTHFGPKYSIYDDSPEWGSASILGPWWLYRMTGETTLLDQQYGTMQRYLEYLRGRANPGIVSYGLGDWYDIGPKAPGFSQQTSLGVTATLTLVEDAQAMTSIAALLGKQEDEAKYDALAKDEASSFRQHFYHAESGLYDVGSQTANAMPLALGIVPAKEREALLSYIVSDIEHHNDHITTGEVGYPYLIRALLEQGRSDIVLAMLLRTDAPSYGSQIAAGATSLTEAWDANPHNSQDHFMLAAADEWLYRGLAGIDIDFSRPVSSERITLQPQILKGISHVEASYQSSSGKIAIKWQKRGSRLFTDIAVPPGAKATLKLPNLAGLVAEESRSPASRAVGVVELAPHGDLAIFEISSGNYHFSSTLPEGY